MKEKKGPIKVVTTRMSLDAYGRLDEFLNLFPWDKRPTRDGFIQDAILSTIDMCVRNADGTVTVTQIKSLPLSRFADNVGALSEVEYQLIKAASTLRKLREPEIGEVGMHSDGRPRGKDAGVSKAAKKAIAEAGNVDKGTVRPARKLA